MTQDLLRIMSMFNIPYRGTNIVFEGGKYRIFGKDYDTLQDAFVAVDKALENFPDTIKTSK